jgi:hypothetical protein
VTKVEVSFLYQWRVGVVWYGEGGWRRWCGFNILVSARERKRQDEALTEDEAETASFSWLHGK